MTSARPPIISLGSNVAPMTPKSASKLYWSVCIPKLAYGLHLMDLQDDALAVTESCHAKFAKVFQGLPDQASNTGAVACMGWLSLEGYIRLMLLMFFMRIISLSADCIYKKVLITRYCYHVYHPDGLHYGPLSRFVALCKEYGLMARVTAAIEDCIIPSKAEWKKLVMDKIWAMENRKLKLMCTICKSLNYMKDRVVSVQLLSWWSYVQLKPQDAYKCRVIIRLLLDCHNLKSCQLRYKREGVTNALCAYCNHGQIETISHVLFSCQALSDLRQLYWNRVLENCPHRLVQEMNLMNLEQKTALLLSCFNNTFIDEWIPLYNAVVNFIYNLYKQRCE